jgi:hypothetical protein
MLPGRPSELKLHNHETRRQRASLARRPPPVSNPDRLVYFGAFAVITIGSVTMTIVVGGIWILF